MRQKAIVGEGRVMSQHYLTPKYCIQASIGHFRTIAPCHLQRDTGQLQGFNDRIAGIGPDLPDTQSS